MDETGKTIHTSSEIIENRQVSENTFLLRFRAPELAALARPGQFIKLRGWPAPADGGLPLLDRPFSLHRIGPGGEIGLLYRVVGRGTALMSALAPGREIKVLGPLGRGLDIKGLAREHGRVYLVAGGIGVAPMAMVGQALRNADFEVILHYGERLASAMVPPELLFPYVGDLELYVEQKNRNVGPEAILGRPVDFLDEALKNRPGQIFACGPLPMLAALAELAEARRAPYYPSMEARMGCGFGVCLSCVLPGADGGHLSACHDGPVIEASRLNWTALKTQGGWGI